MDMKRPSLTITQPIPTEEELNKLEEIFENMEMEKFQRTEKFLNIQSQIKSIINNLNLSPMPGFERDVVTMKDPSKMLTEIHLAELEAFYDRLVEKAEEVVHKISELRSKIENLWSYLDLDIQERDQLRSKFVGNSLDTLKALKDEVERCETLRKANIQTFVEKLRVQLVALWDKCNFTEDQRNRFTDFHSNLYNEDLLDLHEIELKKVTRHYEENK